MSYDKYIKYKTKYLQLKAKHVQQGGAYMWVITDPRTTPITPAESRLLEEQSIIINSGELGPGYSYSYKINANGTGTRTSKTGTYEMTYVQQGGVKKWSIIPGTTPITPAESELLAAQSIIIKSGELGPGYSYSYKIRTNGTGTRTSKSGPYEMNYTDVLDASPSFRVHAPPQHPPPSASRAPPPPTEENIGKYSLLMQNTENRNPSLPQFKYRFTVYSINMTFIDIGESYDDEMGRIYTKLSDTLIKMSSNGYTYILTLTADPSEWEYYY